jgi:propanol-preferring alcohol dehydrogenase
MTDAGLTPFHAIARCRERLGDGSVTAVIGVGGLGHLAVQLLRAVTQTRVIALDSRDSALALAKRAGAHARILAGPQAVRQLRAESGERLRRRPGLRRLGLHIGSRRRGSAVGR